MVTPRFIPSCSDAALEGLGHLARSCNCHIQTHCSESDWQHGYVRARHGVNDAESLDRFGLLTRHTVLAHGNFLSDVDFDLIGARGADQIRRRRLENCRGVKMPHQLVGIVPPYAESLDRFGLLTRHTVLAHGNFLATSISI